MFRMGSRLRAGLLTARAAVTIVALVLAIAPAPSSAASASASLSQCTNGPVAGPTLEQCAGASGGGSVAILNGKPQAGYSNWVTGNANGSKSHWKEGEFIAYRTQVFDTVGSHTIQFSYDTVHSGGHAIDYLGSFDATETTATNCSQTAADGSFTATPGPTCPVPPGFHANYNNPCADLAAPGLITSGCAFDGTQVVAAGSFPVPAAAIVTPPAIQTCGGSGSTGAVAGGSFSQVPGSFKIFGPSGSAITAAGYVSQNVLSGTGQCTTTVSLTFTIGGSGSQNVVLAWGGHIADRADWGLGNSASGINGSPYHMNLVSLDGASTGAQDRALSSNAVFFTPSITTSIDGNNTTIVSAGATVFDTATLANAAPTAGGTVTYNFFTNGTCSGTPSNSQNVTVSGAVVPQSANHGPLTSGSYSFDAVYGGDGSDIGFPTNAAAMSPCEPLTVQAPSVTVSKTTSTPTVLAGSPISYTLTTQNAGPGTATNVNVTDTLPTNAGLSWTISSQSPANSCAIAAGVLTCNYPSLAPTNPPVGTSSTAAPTVTITSPTSLVTCGTVSNTASVTTGNDGGNTTLPVTITVSCPTPSLHKQERDATTNGSFSDGPITVGPGDTIEYQLVYKNNGNGAATNVSISDTLPANTTFVSCSNACSHVGNVLSWNEGTVAGGASVTETFKVTVPVTFANNTYSTSNFATSSDQTGTTTSNTVVANATFGPASSLHKQERDATTNGSFSDGPITAAPGDTIEYQVAYSNAGPGPANNVTITDTVPANTTFVSCSSSCANNAGVLSWSEGTILAGGSATETFKVTLPAVFNGNSLQVSNVANESDQSGSHQSNTVVVNVSYPPSSSLHKQERDASTNGTFSDGPITVNPGDTIEYQLVYKNSGTGPAVNATISDALPANTTFVSCTGGCTNIAGTLSWSLGTIAAGGSATVSFQVTVPTTFASNSYSTSNFAVETDQSGNTQSNTVVATAVFTPSSSLHKQERDATTNGTFSDGPITVSPGDTIEYQLVYTNAGPGPALGVTITDSVPANTTYISCSGSCLNTAGVLSWSLGDIAAGHSISVTFQVSVPATFASNSYSTSNVGSEHDQSGDHVSNTVVANANYAPSSSLHKQERDATTNGSFSDGPITVNPGDVIEYQLTYTNAGPGPAVGVTITDTLPANTTFVSCSSTCANNAGVLSWSEGTIQATGTAVETFQVKVPAVFTSNTYSASNFAIETDQSGDHQSNTVVANATFPSSSALHKQERDVTTNGTFSDGPITVNPGDIVEYQLSYTNNGTGPAIGVTITDQVKSNVTFLTCSNGCTNTAGLLSWNLGTIQAGGAVSVTFQVQVPAVFATNDYSTSNAACASDQTGPNAACSNIVIVVASFPPSSSIHKQERDVTTNGSFSDGPITVNPGDVIEYQLSYVNNGTGPALGVIITDTLPANTSFVSCSNLCTNVAGQLTWHEGDIVAGGTASETFQVKVPATFTSNTYSTNNSACAADQTGSACSNNVVANGSFPANSTLHKQERDVTTNGQFTDAPITVNPGDVIEYQFSYSNTGSGPALNVILTDTVPANTSFVSCSNNCTNLAGQLTWIEGTVAAGGTATETLDVQVPFTFNSNTFVTTNAACVSDQNGSTCSNTVTGGGPFPPNSSLHKQERDLTAGGTFSDGPINVAPGDVIEYQLTYKNAGPGPAVGVTITDTVPANTSFIQCSNLCSNVAGLLIWNEGTIQAGGSATETFQVLVPSQFNNNTYSATNIADETDQSGDHLSNVVVANATFPPQSNLHKQERDVTAGGSFTDGPIVVQPGDVIEYQVVYTNAGPGPAVGVTITDNLPANTTFVQCSNLCGNLAGVLSWSEGTIQAGGFATESFQVQVPPTFNNNSYSTINIAVENDQSGGHPSNPVVANGNFPPHSNLHKQERDVTTGGSFSDGPITVNPGDVVEYELSYSNTGTGPALGVTITDNVPANTTFISCSNLCSNVAGLLTWGEGNIPAGGVATETFQVKVPGTFAGNSYSTSNVAGVTDQTGGGSSNIVVINATFPPASSLHKQERDLTAGAQFGDGPITVAPGDVIEYQLTYTNNGTGPATGVTITDNVPANTTFIGCSGACLDISGDLNWIVGTVPAGGNAVVTFQVQVPFTFTSNSYVTTNAACVSDQTGPNAACSNVVIANGNFPAASTLHKQERDVTTGGTFSDGPITVNPGDVIEYQLVYRNIGTGPALNVVITDNVPANTAFVLCSNGCGNVAGLLSWNEGNIAAGGSATETFQVQVPATFATNNYSASNFALESDQSGGSGSNTVVANGTFSPKSNLHKQDRDVTTGGTFSDGPISVNPGDVIEYQLSYSNTGTGPALNATITDTVPANTTYIGCTGGCVNTAGLLTWNLGNVPAGGTAVETFQVSVPLTFNSNIYTTTNAACVADQTGSACSNTVTGGGPFPPQSGLHKQERDVTTGGTFSDGPITVNPGDTIEYKLVYTNSGSGPAVGVTISDNVPANTTFVSCSNTCGNTAGVLSWNLGTIQAGGSATVTFQVQVPSTFTSNTYQTTNAACVADQAGTTCSNTVTAGGSFLPSSSLHKQERDATTNGSFSDGPITVNPGDTIEYKLVYTNSGSGPALGVTISDTIPANTTFVSCSNTCGNTAGVLSWNEGNIAAGGSATETFQVKVPATFTSNTYSTSNVASESDQSGSHQSNTVVANGSYPGGASLHKQERDVTTGGSYSDGPITVTMGDTIQYQLVYTNTGVGPVTNLKITDAIPANTIFIGGSCSPSCTNSAGTLSWALGTVAAGGTATVTFEVSVSGGLPTGLTRILNTGQSSSDQVPGPTSSNTVEADVTIAIVSQITPTNTTCQQFTSGTASNLVGGVQYSVKSGAINQVNPGVMFYWVSVKVTTAGAQTYNITQTITGGTSRAFLPASGSFAYTAGCSTLNTTVTQNGSITTVKFSAPVPGTYVIGIKYSPGNVVGETVPTNPLPTFTYTFATSGVAGSAQQVKLSPKTP